MQPGWKQSVSNHFPPLYHVSHIPLFLSLALSFMISCSYTVYTYSFHPLPFLVLQSLVSTYLLPPTSCHATISSSHKYTYIPFPSLALLLTPPPPSLPSPPHLNASWSPRYELSQLPLPDALQALVDLGGVHFPLDDVQDGDVAVVVSTITWS